jgi:hypothetical protein
MEVHDLYSRRGRRGLRNACSFLIATGALHLVMGEVGMARVHHLPAMQQV